jgi:hypothetical protein
MDMTPAQLRNAGYQYREERAFVLAADLGQSSDPTAIAVLEHSTTFFQHVMDGTRRRVQKRFDIRHLARLPLGLSYPAVVQEVRTILARPPLVGRCELVIDETGVGRAVADIFDTAGMKPTRVTITAGGEQSGGMRGWHVAKQILISTLDARLHTGELRFAAELLEADAMREELTDFRRKVSVAGRYSYEARVGKHDDLVLAVALALWAVVGRPKPPQVAFGRYSMCADGGGLVINYGDPDRFDHVRDIELYAPRPRPPEHVELRNKLTGIVSQFHRADAKQIVSAPGTIYETTTEGEQQHESHATEI